VVAFITGAGLKTQEAVMPALTPALQISSTIESFEEAVADRETRAWPANGDNGP